MKLLMIAITGLGMSCLNYSFSQSKDFLRNYTAPDFKYRTLGVNFLGNSSGASNQVSNSHLARFSADLNYFHRNNTSLYQGTVRTFNTLSAHGTNTNAGLNWTILNFHRLNTENRFFVKSGNFFLGAHADVVGVHSHIHSLSSSEVNNTMNFDLSPELSFGWGRLEPVNFARQAMDIEYLLKQEGICESLTNGELKSLSDKIALASNRRFFDARHKRIYELETIDSTISDLGFVPNRNMRYFSRMQDAYFFALGNERLSGMRHEVGFNLQTDFDIYSNNEFENVVGLWFYQFSYYLPQSWSLQHNIQSKVAANQYILRWENNYGFQIHPSTRTIIEINANTGANFDFVSGDIGFMLGTGASVTYYISPRFRLSGSFDFNYTDNYLWQPIVSTGPSDRLVYKTDIRLSYAIF